MAIANKQGQECFLCTQYNIITEPRVITFGGILDRATNQSRYVPLFFVGQNPWINILKPKEVGLYRAFGDKSEKILLSCLEKTNIEARHIWITNAVACSVVNNNPEYVKKAFCFCKKRLEDEINYVKPKVIVAMGNVTFELLSSYSNFLVEKIYHPNALSYNPTLREKFIKQLTLLGEKYV